MKKPPKYHLLFHKESSFALFSKLNRAEKFILAVKENTNLSGGWISEESVLQSDNALKEIKALFNITNKHFGSLFVDEAADVEDCQMFSFGHRDYLYLRALTLEEIEDLFNSAKSDNGYECYGLLLVNEAPRMEDCPTVEFKTAVKI